MIGERIRHDLHRRRGSVTEVVDLSERIRRVWIALEPGAAPVPHVPLAVGDHVKLVFPHPQTGELDLEHRERMVLRDYTIRAVPDERSVVIDLVVHGSGPGSTWARDAEIGSTIGILGPRGSHVMPADRARYLVLADESAHPAAARWLEEAPAGAELHLVLETEDALTAELAPRKDSAGSADTTVTLVAGSDGTGLVRELIALDPQPGDLVWAAGEAGAMVTVREAARALGVAKDDLEVDGYWKRGIAGRDHHAPLDE